MGSIKNAQNYSTGNSDILIDFLKIERFFSFPENCTVLLQIVCIHHEVEGLGVNKTVSKNV